jgi:cell division protein FtsZ
LGYDNSLGEKIGITLIATGFEYKDPFVKKEPKKEEPKKEEKIVMTLEMKKDEPASRQFALPLDERVAEDDRPAVAAAVQPIPAAPPLMQAVAAPEGVLSEQLQPKLVETQPAPVVVFTNNSGSKNTVDKPVEKKEEPTYMELVYSQPSDAPAGIAKQIPAQPLQQTTHVANNSPASAASGGYLAKPSNIYAEPQRSAENPCPEHLSPVKQPVFEEPARQSVQKEEEPSFEMQLVIKNEVSTAADEPRAPQTQQPPMLSTEDPAMRDEVDDQKRRAAERIQKLRNLSFNINAADANNEFETVPAYIRRNLELYNTVSPAENFYSNYEVKSDENNNGQISTINTFLDGKKPD